ncbi:transcription factor TFIIH complex subunit Tfb5-domain-containing protein [Fimicolochytrium jonesii]|uniref:transcription factor TFIIH complex subunit Tfb5-domain-containing protein n=1 Tax=Fimicolochytrium jonesii TaxID=1396493 RepID=UPI0022FE1054|nr:transcription factor TFIIH complex subunit Tfb5-domain-containing protein [Fimicolochytrium jonesii]KAI8817373.1 transcription factor TFIIH complex subunit Tfb5-domain-containing protein [Fimicolochytrium jonesii]
MVKAKKGVLLECDPAVKQIVQDLDAKRFSETGKARFILESLDETHLFVDTEIVPWLQDRLNEILEVRAGVDVRSLEPFPTAWFLFAGKHVPI